MIFGFKDIFREPIRLGTKDQTIRKERKDGKRPKPGERLYFYTGLRTKRCRKIGEATCTEVLDILIYPKGTAVWIFIDRIFLRIDATHKLATRDGFKDIATYIAFFRQVHTLPFEGFVVRWKDFESTEVIK